MPIIVNDPQLKGALRVQEAVFFPDELRDRDWMLKGYANCEDGSCTSLNTTEENILLLQQDIRHHLRETHKTLQMMERPLEIIRAVLESPNTQEIPDILRNILDVLQLMRARLAPDPKPRTRRKPARRTTKSRKSRRR